MNTCDKPAMSPDSNLTSMAKNTSHLACDKYIIVCLSLTKNIHHGQQVSVLGRFICCMKSKSASPPNLTCLVYTTDQLLGSLRIECREPCS